MSEWDSYAADWDGDPAARAYAAAAFASLKPLLENAGLVLGGASVLDFGCGTGLLTEQLVDSGAAVIAVDDSTAMLDVVQSKIDERPWNNVQLATRVASTPGSHQLIVCSSVCSFLDDYPAMVRTLVEHLVPGGLFVQWDWEREEPVDPGHESHGLSRSQIDSALQAAGLQHVTVDIGFEAPFEDQMMRPLIGYGTRPRDARVE